MDIKKDKQIDSFIKKENEKNFICFSINANFSIS